MTPQAEAKVLEQLDAIVVQLGRIATALERAVEPPPPLMTGCDHPFDYRTDLGGMGSAEEWLCDVKKGGCGFRYSGDVAGIDASTPAIDATKE